MVSKYYKKNVDFYAKKKRQKLYQKPRDMDYLKRLNILNLTTLEGRRLRGDLIQKFKFEKINWLNGP
jgi:hypothetical protein